MAWAKSDVLAAYNALSPAPASDQAATDALNAQTVNVIADTSGAPVKGILYARQSWNRVQQVGGGLVTGGSVTPAITAICADLLDQARHDAPVRMSIAGINKQVQADLDTLAAAKMSDGKGIIWAADEYAVGDPGDKAVLLSQLVNLTVSKWQPALSALDIAAITGK